MLAGCDFAEGSLTDQTISNQQVQPRRQTYCFSKPIFVENKGGGHAQRLFWKGSYRNISARWGSTFEIVCASPRVVEIFISLRHSPKLACSLLSTCRHGVEYRNRSDGGVSQGVRMYTSMPPTKENTEHRRRWRVSCGQELGSVAPTLANSIGHITIWVMDHLTYPYETF